MRIANLCGLVACAVLAACGQKTPPANLSFDELATVVQGCEKSGKSATEAYCKEAAAVYAPQFAKRAEAARLSKVQARAASMNSSTSAPVF